MSRKKQLQVNCRCSRWPFPHRLGSCNGTEWAESYASLDGVLCENCTHRNTGFSGCRGDRSGQCDVISGAEDIKLCPAYEEHLHYQPSIRLPMSIENFIADSMDDNRFGECYA